MAWLDRVAMVDEDDVVALPRREIVIRLLSPNP
jgi:hypothetical protein